MLMCVLLVAVFFVNPLYFTGHHPNIIGGHTPGGMRTLSSVEDPRGMSNEGDMFGVVCWGVLWLVRLLVAAACFGWIHIRSVANLDSSSPEGVKFWRFWKQAQQDLHKVYTFAVSNQPVCFLAASRRVPLCHYCLSLPALCVCVCVLQGEYCACRDSVESALAVIGRPVPTSSFSLVTALLWASISHLLFQVLPCPS